MIIFSSGARVLPEVIIWTAINLILNRNHFYFEGTVPDIPDVGDFYDECEPGCPKNRNSRKNPSIAKS